MSKPQFVTGLRAVEQLLANRSGEVKKLLVEYRTANPRIEAVIAKAKELGVEVQEANRARLKQISGEWRHQGRGRGQPARPGLLRRLRRQGQSGGCVHGLLLRQQEHRRSVPLSTPICGGA